MRILFAEVTWSSFHSPCQISKSLPTPQWISLAVGSRPERALVTPCVKLSICLPPPKKFVQGRSASWGHCTTGRGTSIAHCLTARSGCHAAMHPGATHPVSKLLQSTVRLFAREAKCSQHTRTTWLAAGTSGAEAQAELGCKETKYLADSYLEYGSAALRLLPPKPQA